MYFLPVGSSVWKKILHYESRKLERVLFRSVNVFRVRTNCKSLGKSWKTVLFVPIHNFIIWTASYQGLMKVVIIFPKNLSFGKWKRAFHSHLLENDKTCKFLLFHFPFFFRLPFFYPLLSTGILRDEKFSVQEKIHPLFSGLGYYVMLHHVALRKIGHKRTIF